MLGVLLCDVAVTSGSYKALASEFQSGLGICVEINFLLIGCVDRVEPDEEDRCELI